MPGLPSPVDREILERELNLRQHQINTLLQITQAINNNVSARDLYGKYQEFLEYELGLGRMALFVYDPDGWTCSASIGIDHGMLEYSLDDILPRYTEMQSIEGEEHPFLAEFEVVIPVRHKEEPIAYVFVGSFKEEDDLLSKLKFITTLTNIISVAIENKRLFKRQLEQERLKREMELAAEMQRMLIPSQLPDTGRYELASIYKPHYGVGGDYFDFLEMEEGKIAFCVGDISGKGVAAALLMANFQANFHSLIHKGSGLDEFIRALNGSVNLITEGDRFITFFIAQYNIKDRVLRYVNAGHNPPLLVTEDTCHLLNKGCTILGFFPELPEVEVGMVSLEDEALILSFTDGLTDIQNRDGVFLSEDVLVDFALENHGLDAVAFNQRLMQHIEEFKGEQTYPDDFTVLTCKVR